MLFGQLGLQINNGKCAHGTQPPPTLTITKSALLGHNFLRSNGQDNEVSSPDRLRQLFMAGMIADLEFSLRATATATEKSTFGINSAQRASRAAKRLQAAQGRLKQPLLEEVQTVFGLKPSGDSRYAYSELLPNMEDFRSKIAELREKKSDELTQVEQKFASMNQKLSLYNLLTVSYRMPPLPDPSSAGESEEARQAFTDQLMQILAMVQQIEAGSPPAIIPPAGEPDPMKPESDKWQAYGPAIFATYVQNLMSTERVDPNPALRSFTDVLDAVREGKSPEINMAVTKYMATISELPIAAKKMGKAKTESWFNKFAPTA
ncbi:MAG: hypothetical protein B7Z55_18370, partial [Planctomycetales bacterium 12-60-4]